MEHEIQREREPIEVPVEDELLLGFEELPDDAIALRDDRPRMTPEMLRYAKAPTSLQEATRPEIEALMPTEWMAGPEAEDTAGMLVQPAGVVLPWEADEDAGITAEQAAAARHDVEVARLNGAVSQVRAEYHALDPGEKLEIALRADPTVNPRLDRYHEIVARRPATAHPLAEVPDRHLLTLEELDAIVDENDAVDIELEGSWLPDVED